MVAKPVSRARQGRTDAVDPGRCSSRRCSRQKKALANVARRQNLANEHQHYRRASGCTAFVFPVRITAGIQLRGASTITERGEAIKMKRRPAASAEKPLCTPRRSRPVRCNSLLCRSAQAPCAQPPRPKLKRTFFNRPAGCDTLLDSPAALTSSACGHQHGARALRRPWRS
jgi:hypothetical protein